MNALTKLNRVWMSTIVVMAIIVSFSSQSFADGMAIKSGTFAGINNHVSTGTVEIVKTDAGYVIKLGADFTFDGAPDPKIALGKDGKYDSTTLIELLRSLKGEQSYAVPASINVADYNEVHIWCEKFNVGLAIAPVN